MNQVFPVFGQGETGVRQQIRRDRDGVLYPGGSTLEGSAALNALITVYPHNSDWDHIATLTGDPGWNAEAMCSRFQQLEAWRGREDDPMAVLDGNFRVRGIKGLRVVDASAFPCIPSFFIASAVYMVSERASDVIVAEHGGAKKLTAEAST